MEGLSGGFSQGGPGGPFSQPGFFSQTPGEATQMDNVEMIDGFEFHGVSITTDKGKRNITDHSVVEVVTFSFFLFLSFKVKRPPIQ